MIDSVLNAVLYIYLGSVAVIFIRIVIGPTAVDRMIGLNIVGAQVLAMLVILAVEGKNAVYLDVALVYDIFGFVGILAITKYLERREDKP